MRDGASTNNPWLLELPDPITKLTWGNAAMLSKTTASRLGISSGDVVRLSLEARTLEVPALVVPGHADDAVSLTLGYGRSGAESVARGVGVDAFRLREEARPWGRPGLGVSATGAHVELALAQGHFAIEGRTEEIVRRTTLANLGRAPGPARHDEPRSLYSPPAHDARQWGMVIDLSACTGCSACVVACQAENNIPTVGAVGVSKGREMHWLRIDRYFRTTPTTLAPSRSPWSASTASAPRASTSARSTPPSTAPTG